ncbi:hypothetical protein PO909_011103 [Leuciscus waleckii]
MCLADFPYLLTHTCVGIPPIFPGVDGVGGKRGGSAAQLKSLAWSPPVCIGPVLAYERRFASAFAWSLPSHRWLRAVVPLRLCLHTVVSSRLRHRGAKPEKNGTI